MKFLFLKLGKAINDVFPIGDNVQQSCLDILYAYRHICNGNETEEYVNIGSFTLNAVKNWTLTPTSTTRKTHNLDVNEL